MLPARDGLEALALYARHRQEISRVLLDVVMSPSRGCQVLAALRNLNSWAKILLVAGYDLQQVAEELVRPGTVGVIQKPYSLRSLAHAEGEGLRPEKKGD